MDGVRTIWCAEYVFNYDGRQVTAYRYQDLHCIDFSTDNPTNTEIMQSEMLSDYFYAVFTVGTGL